MISGKKLTHFGGTTPYVLICEYPRPRMRPPQLLENFELAKHESRNLLFNFGLHLREEKPIKNILAFPTIFGERVKGVFEGMCS